MVNKFKIISENGFPITCTYYGNAYQNILLIRRIRVIRLMNNIRTIISR